MTFDPFVLKHPMYPEAIEAGLLNCDDRGVMPGSDLASFAQFRKEHKQAGHVPCGHDMLRHRWLRFLGFDLGAPMPDADTIRLFREKLTDAGALDAVFPDLDRRLKERGYLAMGGQIVDATLVAAPKQRNTAPEKDAIKAGNTAGEIWRDEPARAAQKDTDARWTLKFAKAKPMADCKPGIEIAIARSRTASRWPSGAPRPAPPIRRSVPVSNMCSSGRKTRWAVHLHHRR